MPAENGKPPGTIVLVSTPIGNLGDMTYRGVETLKEAAAILTEDTRRTGTLLRHYGIRNELVVYHDHNKERVTPRVIERLKSGDTLALVSDAGTPGISDPGYYLVRAAIAERIPVGVVPGANAILPALLLSGFPTDAFVFEGFVPRKKGELQRKFAALADETRTVICFVSPHQLLKVLDIVAEVLADRSVAVVREISKVYEETRRGAARDVADYFRSRRVRGEFVLLIKGRGK